MVASLSASLNRGHNIVNIAETALLPPVAVDLKRFMRQRPLREARQDHAVLPDLPRTDRVEQAKQRDRQADFGMIGEGEKLVDRLGRGIAPAAAPGRPGERIVIFAERKRDALPIDLGGGGDQDAPAITAGRLQDHFRTADVDLNGIDRPVDDVAHSDGRRQMKNDVAFAHEPVDDVDIANVFDGEIEVREGRQAFNIFEPTGGEIIDNGHLVAGFQQAFRKVTADEAGAAGD